MTPTPADTALSAYASPATPSRDEVVVEALRYGREYDWPGHHVAGVLAMVYLFLLPLATAPKDWAFAILAAWTLIRLPHTWRSYGAFLRIGLPWLMLAWACWELLSFTWTHNLDQAWDEFKVQRMLVTPLLLWPILDRAPWLVMAALAGVLAQNGVQVLQDIGWVAMPMTGEGRLRGLIHPIHSAMWFGAAMLWHLSAGLNLRGWVRWLSLALIVASCAGLLATGSRGPWIASAAALIAAMVIMPIRSPRMRRPALALTLIGVAAIAITWASAPAMIQQRLRDARSEIFDARDHQKYWTSTGLRLGLWGWAVEVWRSSPIVGVGAGGFADAYQQLDSFKQASDFARESSMREEAIDYAAAKAAGRDVTALRGYRRGLRLAENRLDYLTRDHAHSTYLHTLVSEGVVGLALLVAVLLAAIRQCWRDRLDHPYADAMLFVLLGWIVGAQFDCYELNGHQLGLLMLIVALTLPGRAKVRWQWSAIGESLSVSATARD